MPLLHQKIIRSKPFLKKLYTDFYRRLGRRCPDLAQKTCVELGSGGGFLKEVYPSVLTSDVVPLPGVDKVFSVLEMPFGDGAVDYFLMFNVFHHVPDAGKFLGELDRCLKPGGKAVMIEPANTLWGRFIYKNFHHEAFDPAGSWRLPKAAPLSSANAALPWIVFHRDRKIFQEDFPRLKLTEFKAHTPLKYLVSGGVSMHPLVPSCAYAALNAFERLLSPLDPVIGMFYTIELSKGS